MACLSLNFSQCAWHLLKFCGSSLDYSLNLTMPGCGPRHVSLLSLLSFAAQPAWRSWFFGSLFHGKAGGRQWRQAMAGWFQWRKAGLFSLCEQWQPGCVTVGRDSDC